MALTPEDVVNKRFQPTKFREGYDQDEFDDFLDEVVVELRRLGQENEELRQRLLAGESRIAELQRSGGAQSADSQSADVEQAQFASAPVVAAAPVPAPPAAQDASETSDETADTNNLLQLARKLHDEHVREGVEKRDALIAEGHAAAARLVGEAEAAQQEQLGALDNERVELERRIEGLRTFEREYRQKLKGYIEGQLRELEAPGSVTSAPQPAAYPAQGVDSADSADSEQSESPSFPQPAQPVGYQGFGGN